MAKKPMKIEIKRPGALHKKAGVAKGKKIPEAKIKKLEKSSNPLTRKQAVFADNARKWNK